MTTTTLSLTDFLLARIAEDEDGRARDLRTLAESLRGLGGFGQTPDHLEHEADRVLAECEAKRRIVERFGWSDDITGTEEHTLRILASVYADHPEFREGWRLG